MRNGLTILPETYTICMYMRLSNEDDYLPKGKDESTDIERYLVTSTAWKWIPRRQRL